MKPLSELRLTCFSDRWMVVFLIGVHLASCVPPRVRLFIGEEEATPEVVVHSPTTRPGILFWNGGCSGSETSFPSPAPLSLPRTRLERGGIDRFARLGSALRLFYDRNDPAVFIDRCIDSLRSGRFIFLLPCISLNFLHPSEFFLKLEIHRS